jgi:hypothetical protein
MENIIFVIVLLAGVVLGVLAGNKFLPKGKNSQPPPPKVVA